jgi:hypothetical protein
VWTADGRSGLVRLLVEGFRVFEWRLYEELREASYGDVRPAHYAVFRYLKGEGSRVTVLAQAGMTKQSMGGLVDHLEQRGYVERHRDPGMAGPRSWCRPRRGDGGSRRPPSGSPK